MGRSKKTAGKHSRRLALNPEMRYNASKTCEYGRTPDHPELLAGKNLL
ncbi:MAG: hypothetical protein IJI61_02045 [Oscillospiraceae bacterium]|nr:hypothetical protein [Oscillospiraceae bacterium]